MSSSVFLLHRAKPTLTLLSRSLSSSVTKTSSIATTTSTVASSKEVARIKAEQEALQLRNALEAEKSPVQKYVEQSREVSPHMIWGSLTPWKDPELPQVVSEVAALDPAHTNQDPPSLATGEKRMVLIRQEHAKPSQAPTDIESQWVISFHDDGEFSQCWDNPLMGWVSSSDPMANNMRLQMAFRNASEAVYFAKKRGWDYIVAEPIVRYARNDGAQYQDNFLPQDVAAKVRRERKKCKHWERSAAGTSHYQRPLTYDGKTLARQHGPNLNEPVAPHVDGYYKMR